MPPRRGNRGRVPMGAPMPGFIPAMFPQQSMLEGPPDIGMGPMGPFPFMGGMGEPAAPQINPFDAMLQNAMQQSMAAGQRRNLFLPEGGFFGEHPRVSRGIENALLFAGGFQGGDTVGENIGAVARGLMGLEPQRQQIQMQRMMAPFGAIKPYMDIQEAQSQINYRRDQGELARAQAERARSTDELAFLKAQTTRPQRDDEGTWVFKDKGWTFVPYTEPELRKRRIASGNMIERQIAIEEQESGRAYTAGERAKRIGALGAMIGYGSAFGGATGRIGAGDIPESITGPRDIRYKSLIARQKSLVGFLEDMPEDLIMDSLSPENRAELQDIQEEISAMSGGTWRPGWTPKRKSTQPNLPGELSPKVQGILRGLGVELP